LDKFNRIIHIKKNFGHDYRKKTFIGKSTCRGLKNLEPEKEHNLHALNSTTNEGSVDLTTPGLSRDRSANVTNVLELVMVPLLVTDAKADVHLS
jgi:CheY-specific phosphatase CheX